MYDLGVEEETFLSNFVKTAIGGDSNIILFCRNWQGSSKIHRKCKGPRIAQTTSKHNSKFGEWTLPDLSNYKTAIIKIVWHWHKDK